MMIENGRFLPSPILVDACPQIAVLSANLQHLFGLISLPQ
jgi:hypothetical protein